MDATAKQFRESRLTLLAFYASPQQQLEWQSRTPTLDSDEIMCWWLDDWHPESSLFRAAFAELEIAMLASFSSDFGRVADKFAAAGPKVAELLIDRDWQAVIANAQALVGALRDAT